MSNSDATDTALLVLTTLADEHHAQRIADTVVSERLAACVSRIPGVLSTYQWQGEVQHDAEMLLLFKTTRQRWPALRERVLELHPYELPEVIAVPVSEGHAAYLAWIRSQCT